MSWVILENLAGIILKNVEGCVVEIGVASLQHGSTKILYDHAKKAGVKFYTCDPHPRKIITPEYEWHKHFPIKSEEFIKIFDDTPALVFLDGCPEYDVVIKDVRFFLDKLAVGGGIFLHNTYPPEERFLDRGAAADCYRVRQEMEREKDVDCFTWPYPSIQHSVGLTMILKKPKDRPYYQE